jgi:hypothetical protein
MIDVDAEVEELTAHLDRTIRAFAESRGGVVRADIMAGALLHLLSNFLMASPDRKMFKLGVKAVREQLQYLSDEWGRRIQPEAGLQ